MPHALLRADPALRVLVIEREMVGFGASGRNGGWCVGELAGGLGALSGATWVARPGIDYQGDHRHRRRDRTRRRVRGDRVRIRTRRRAPTRSHRTPAAPSARRGRRVPPPRVRRRRARRSARRDERSLTVGHVGARWTPLCAWCAGAASAARPRARRGRRAARWHDRRAHGRVDQAGLAGSATSGDHRPRRRACRRGRSRDRGLQPRPAGSAPLSSRSTR